METLHNNTNKPVLNKEDAHHCDQLFIKYYHYIQYLNDQLSTVTPKHDSYINRYSNRSPQSLYKDTITSDYILSLTDEKKTATITLIYNIEEYFRDKYSISFSKLLPDNLPEITPLENYTAVIENMISQVGADLLAAGAKHIKDNFVQFNLPSIVANLIKLPVNIPFESYSDGRAVIPAHSHTKLDEVLRTIALFYYETPVLTQELQNVLKLLMIRFQPTKRYTACPFVKIAIMYNNSVELIFNNEENALAFWNFYRLRQYHSNI